MIQQQLVESAASSMLQQASKVAKESKVVLRYLRWLFSYRSCETAGLEEQQQ
jgi:hypothetical protein